MTTEGGFVAAVLTDGEGVGLCDMDGLEDSVEGAERKAVADGLVDCDADGVSRGLGVAADADGEPLSDRGGLCEPDAHKDAPREELADGDRLFFSDADADGEPEIRALALPLRLKLALTLTRALDLTEIDIDPLEVLSSVAFALTLGDDVTRGEFVNVAHTEIDAVARPERL